MGYRRFCETAAALAPSTVLALVAQLVEHVLGKDGVTGSNPVEGWKHPARRPEGGGVTLVNPLRTKARLTL